MNQQVLITGEGFKEKILLDSGGTTSFISKRMVDRAGLVVKPNSEPIPIRVGNDFTFTSHGSVTQKLHIQDLVDTVTFQVIDMVDGVDIILGCDWLKRPTRGHALYCLLLAPYPAAELLDTRQSSAVESGCRLACHAAVVLAYDAGPYIGCTRSSRLCRLSST